jgi:hypothetical protein
VNIHTHQVASEQATTTSQPLPIWINPKELSFEGAKRFKKIASIQARLMQHQDIVITVASNVLETSNRANPGDYLVTNPTGEQYIVPAHEFHQRYRLKPGTTDIYESILPPVRVILTTRPVAFIAPWGTPMYIQAGGALVEHPNGCYGIQPDEFSHTYRCVDAQ